MTEAALFESMDCPHTQTIKFTFKNETVNKAWSHQYLNMCHMKNTMFCLEHCFKQAKHMLI